MSQYKPFKNIDFGFSDAEDYSASYKDMFNTIFIKDELNEIMKENTYYLIGEKGTGKTAYAVFFENNDYKNTLSVRMNLEDTDILYFINMKNQGCLPLSNYKDIWEVVLMIIIIRSIREKDLDARYSNRIKQYKEMKLVLEKYNLLSHTPEVITVLNTIERNVDSIVSELKVVAAIIKSKIQGETNSEVVYSRETKVIQNPMQELKSMLTDMIKNVRLCKNRFLFVDKIDIYTPSISYQEYLDWVKALAEATYHLNNGVFSKIKDSKGFIKIMLLIRPDIFGQLHLYNQGNRIRNNSIVLDWQTTYKDYKHSKLFKLADNLLRYANKEMDQKEPKEEGFYWGFYFRWKSRTTDPSSRQADDAFISFLRYSLCRPRDIIEFLKAIGQQAKLIDSNQLDTTWECFNSYKCQKSISDYFLQEASDWCQYKYPNGEFDAIRHFFGFMNTGKKITYEEYLVHYEKYIESCRNRKQIKIFQEMETAEDFLQLLYDLNMICYVETNDLGEQYQTYCYRMRSISDLSPKVPPNKEYRVHRALLKSLNIEGR